MLKKLNVPYFSQFENVKDKAWQSGSCAIVCLKMILEYYKEKDCACDVPEIEQLIQEGVSIGGLNENKDWIHDKLVILLRNHGISSHRQEFRTNNTDYAEKISADGIKKFVSELKNKKPVIVSVLRKFKEDGTFHMVVLTGFEKDKNGEVVGFFYNDPDTQENQTGKNLFVSIFDFKKCWRKMAIF